MEQIFQKSVLSEFVEKQNDKLIEERWHEFKKYQINVKENITDKKSFIYKELTYQTGFFQDVFEKCLGYTLDIGSLDSTLKQEVGSDIDGKRADGAIFVNDKVVGVIELKAQNTKQLNIQPSKDILSPIDQAFRYLNSHDSQYCKYVIVSNFDELLFYIQDKVQHEPFNLFTLDFEDFRRLHTILSYESISRNLPIQIKQASATFEKKITDELYKDYTKFRIDLFENIKINNTTIDEVKLLAFTQKLIDRIVFILFAEDTNILPINSIYTIIDKYNNQNDGWGENKSLYGFYKIYFDAIDKGNNKLDISPYNGGLFAKDDALDNLIIDDYVLKEKAEKLSDYRFGSDISVNILGHIFEKSITALEEITAQIQNADYDKKKSQQKIDGAFYTPQYITRYIVDNTLGKLCIDKKIELSLHDIEEPKNPKRLSKKEKEKEKLNLETIYKYKDWLLNLKILDPACGSGAFLNQALEFLLSEHKFIDDYRRLYENEGLGLYDTKATILKNNLYGVDINEGAVDIAKLSLWLSTAERGEPLTSLAEKIKVGNSLIDDKSIVDNAFVWEEIFPEVFRQGGFDVIIGNPPYVQLQSMGEMSAKLKTQNYQTFEKTGDAYVLFYELGNKLLRENGLLGYITSNKWMRANYGKSLRKYLSKQTNPKILIEVGNSIFKEATVDTNILIFEKQKATKYDCQALDLSKEKTLTEFDFSKGVSIDKFSADNWIISSPAEQQIKKKIEEVGIPLKDWDVSINFGIKTGFNDAFLVDNGTKEKLIQEDTSSIKLLKPLLRGKDIQRYYPEFADMWLIATFPALRLDINKYPAIKNYLESFGKKLYQIGEKYIDEDGVEQKTRKKTKNQWYETQDPIAYYQDFENELLIWKRIGSILRFSLGKYFCLDSTCILSSEYNKYLLCVFNSKMGHYLMKDSPKTGTGDLLISVQAIEPLKIPMIDNQEPFIEKADAMIELNKIFQTKKTKFLNRITDNFNLDKFSKKLEAFYELDFRTFLNELKKKKVTLTLTEQDEWEDHFDTYQKDLLKIKEQIDATDKEIDEMVYELYGLNEEEIDIVKKSI